MKRNVWKIFAAVLAAVVLLSLSAVTVFAETEPATEASDAATNEPAGTDAADTDAADTDAADTAEAENEAADTGAADDDAEDEHDHDHESSTSNYWLLTLIILAVIIVGCVIWILADRARALKMWRSFKSEFKKIVWFDPHETLKSTVLVVIAIIVFAAVIGLVDYLLSLGIVTLGRIF